MTEMLTAKDMQALLHVDRSTIYRMVEAGRLPALKVGKQWRFPKAQVDTWLEEQSATDSPTMPATPPVEFEANCNLAHLLPVDCVQLIQDTFADILGVMIVVTDMQGQPITQVSNACGVFQAISHQPDALQKCLQSWHALAHTIDLVPKLTPSHLGLLCARAFIRLGPELKGMVVIGCIAPENWPPNSDGLAEIASDFGVTPAELHSHLNEVHTLNKDQQDKALSQVQKIADIMAHIITERKQMMAS